MIGRSGILFFKKQTTDNSESENISLGLKDLDGDSGVGQAPEFPSKSSKKNSPLLSKIGTALIIFSTLGFLLTYGPIVQVEIGYRLSRSLGQKEAPKGTFADILNKTVLGEIEGVPDPNFSLVIPKIHAKGKVVANVDPGDYSAYMEALKAGVAHAAGTGLPGSPQTIYLFAHSTDSPLNILRYNAIFYLLRELEVGDTVELYYQGAKHRYTVSDKRIVEPTDVSFLSATNAEQKEQVILQTCWPPGTTFKRLLVFAQK